MKSSELISMDESVWPIGEAMRLTQSDVYQLHADFLRATSFSEFALQDVRNSVYGCRCDQRHFGIECHRLSCHYVLTNDPAYFSQLALFIKQHSVMPLAVLMECAMSGLDACTSYLCFRFALLEIPKGTWRFTAKNFRHLASCAAGLNRGDTLPERASVFSSSELAA